jgi:hypothetical protein
LKYLRISFALALVPLATGTLVVTYHDAVLTHWPARAVIQAQLREGTFPFVHPGASFGQPLAGNPNFGVFFPDTLLLLVLPLNVAFGLRFALALALAFVGARRWARAEGHSREASETAAWAFVLSGVFLSAWRFFNTGLALAIAPWVLAAFARLLRRAEAGDRRAVRRATAELGLWAGLEVLAGEPVVVLLTAVVALVRTLSALTTAPRAGLPRRTTLAFLGLAALIAAAVAAPQIAATAQILPDSSRQRNPFPFVVATGTSTHPIRLLEQVIPFPHGRPDLQGPLGFNAHEEFDHHTPYLWTLHVGLPVLTLLFLFVQPKARNEGVLLVLSLIAAVLAFGRYLPLSRELFPLLSLDGRIRFPVKWWYVVTLALVPLAAVAIERWRQGERPRRGRVLGTGLFLATVLVALVMHWPASTLVQVGATASLLVAAAIWASASRTDMRPAPVLAAGLSLSLALAHTPLFLTFLDVPPAAPPRLASGRILANLHFDPHPVGPATFPESPTRLLYRRASAELWPLTGAQAGIGYAFDDDPDGAYSDDDREVRKRLEDLPWSDRAAELRLSGVTHVLSDEPLPEPFRELQILNAAEGVRLYGLGGATSSVRFATRILRDSNLEGILAAHRDPAFDPANDAALLGRTGEEGQRTPGAPQVLLETAGRLVARVEAPVPGLLVWPRTFFSAWSATVDGVRAVPIRVDGHFAGVSVPAGHHEIRVYWSAGPVLAGLILSGLGLAAAKLSRPGPWSGRPSIARAISAVSAFNT